MAAKLHFSLVSPERELFAGEVDQVDAPGSEGDFGVLAGHAPFMTTLKEGRVKATDDGDVTRVFGGARRFRRCDCRRAHHSGGARRRGYLAAWTWPLAPQSLSLEGFVGHDRQLLRKRYTHAPSARQPDRLWPPRANAFARNRRQPRRARANAGRDASRPPPAAGGRPAPPPRALRPRPRRLHQRRYVGFGPAWTGATPTAEPPVSPRGDSDSRPPPPRPPPSALRHCRLPPRRRPIRRRFAVPDVLQKVCIPSAGRQPAAASADRQGGYGLRKPSDYNCGGQLRSRRPTTSR